MTSSANKIPEQRDQLRQLGRTELLEMMLAQSRLNEQLSKRIEQLEARLQDRALRLSKVGSMAEAALSLNGVFEAAEEACQQYLENVRLQSERKLRLGEELVEHAKKSADEITGDTVRKCEEMKRAAQKECEEMRRTARKECEALKETTRQQCEEEKRQAHCAVEKNWSELSARLLNLYATHKGMEDMVEQEWRRTHAGEAEHGKV